LTWFRKSPLYILVNLQLEATLAQLSALLFQLASVRQR